MTERALARYFLDPTVIPGISLCPYLAPLCLQCTNYLTEDIIPVIPEDPPSPTRGAQHHYGPHSLPIPPPPRTQRVEVYGTFYPR